VEVQLINTLWSPKRGFFYLTRLMLEDFDEGSDYDMMPPTRAVTILGKDEYDDGRAVHRIGLGSNRVGGQGKAMRGGGSQGMQGRTLEDVLRSCDELERWMCLLHVGCNDAEATHALSEGNEAMEGYMRLHERATASPEVRMRYDYGCPPSLTRTLESRGARPEAKSKA